jgi:urease accessory protein UreH
VTPPGLGPLPPAGHPAGRCGGLRLALEARGAATYLARCYQQVPLRVLPPLGLGPGQPALLYLLNPTAGLLDGDAQLVEVEAGPGTRAVLVGQLANRIHPCPCSLSTQQWRVRVARGAVLVVLPGPAIPFAGCRYYQRVEADLEEGAALLWGDVWLSGRYARGPVSEAFRFAVISSEMTVRRGGLIVYRDHFRWDGPWDAEAAAWHFGAGHAAGACSSRGRWRRAGPKEGAASGRCRQPLSGTLAGAGRGPRSRCWATCWGWRLRRPPGGPARKGRGSGRTTWRRATGSRRRRGSEGGSPARPRCTQLELAAPSDHKTTSRNATSSFA